MVRKTLRTTAAAVTALAVLSACGGGNVSDSKLQSKLKSEPQIKTLEQNAGSQSGKVDKVVACIAKALEKDGDQDDLKKYVDGKMNLADIGGKKKGSAKAAQSDAQSCAKSAVSGT